jgi:intergrase/recombinase
VTLDALPDVALLKIFDFYLDGHQLCWYMLVHVSKVAKHSFWVSAPPELATLLQNLDISEGAGCLATLAHHDSCRALRCVVQG